MVFPELHLADEVRYYQIDYGVSCNLVTELVELAMAGHHPEELLAFLQLLAVKAAQNGMHLGVYGTIYCHIKVEDSQDLALNLQDLVLVDEPLALGDHLADFGRVDLIHLASDEHTAERNLLIIFLNYLQVRCQLMEYGHCKVLGVFGDFFGEGEHPLDRLFSILLVDRIDGVGRRVGGLRKGGERGAFV